MLINLAEIKLATIDFDSKFIEFLPRTVYYYYYDYYYYYFVLLSLLLLNYLWFTIKIQLKKSL